MFMCNYCVSIRVCVFSSTPCMRGLELLVYMCLLVMTALWDEVCASMLVCVCLWEFLHGNKATRFSQLPGQRSVGGH